MAFRVIITEEAAGYLFSTYGVRIPVGGDTSDYGLGGVIARYAKSQRIRIPDIEEAIRQAMYRGSYHEKLVDEIEPIGYVTNAGGLPIMADKPNGEARQLVFPFSVGTSPILVSPDDLSIFLNPDGTRKRRKRK